MSVHLGARDDLTWAVERESATVAEVNEATEVVMPLDTLRMLEDLLYTVLVTLRIRRSSESLAASTQTLGHLDDWKSKSIAQRNPFI